MAEPPKLLGRVRNRRTQRPDRLPVAGLVLQLLYGLGLRLLEALMLHVKDINFACGQLTAACAVSLDVP
jgi:integrase